MAEIDFNRLQERKIQQRDLLSYGLSVPWFSQAYNFLYMPTAIAEFNLEKKGTEIATSWISSDLVYSVMPLLKLSTIIIPFGLLFRRTRTISATLSLATILGSTIIFPEWALRNWSRQFLIGFLSIVVLLFDLREKSISKRVQDTREAVKDILWKI